jgi:hypothetical protein
MKPLVVTLDINDLHNLFGHAHFRSSKWSAKYYKVQFCGTFNTCVACALAQIRQKNMVKVLLSKSLHPGAHIYFDISSSIWPSYDGVNYWILIVNDYFHIVGVVLSSTNSD